MNDEIFMKSFLAAQQTAAILYADKNSIVFIKHDNPDISLNKSVDSDEYFKKCIEYEYICSDNKEEFLNEVSCAGILSYFQAGNTEKTVYYRKKSGNTYRWSRMKIFPSCDSSEDNHVFFIVTEDVHMNMVDFFSKNQRKQSDFFDYKNDEKLVKVQTFGNFEVYDCSGNIIHFRKKKSKQLFAYLVDNYGYPVTTADVVADILEKPADNLNAMKYVSTIIRSAIDTLEEAGYRNVIIKEWNSVHINTSMIDCDYYHLIEGDLSYLKLYHNEYMKEYSWAEATNAEIQQYGKMNI